ncbi:SCO7613 C-terminal domain-containing membrane protein [Streptomyces sp. V1I6]|uniref:SCO7613 C-terminal domain-containing membrane protein n=1 Tax=Streptomyces sp. V1I6 TaxID=3042273 RepID=UPI0035931DFF
MAATWVRLAASDVTSPEAYTLPVTAAALTLGVLRRRKDPQASSWTAYGPGLAATLVPSLVAAWGDEHWLRPLLLGLAALAVTLAGARLKLQALLVLGGAVLALDALHELAPYVAQVVGALPRWLPPALVGLLLLGVGATYEQRLRDARRLRESLGRMR